MMDFAGLSSFVAMVAMLVSIANTLWIWLSKGGQKAAAELEKVNEKLDAHGTRIERVENDLRHLPSKDDITNLKLSVAEINGKLGAFEGELSSVARTTRRIEEFLLKEVK